MILAVVGGIALIVTLQLIVIVLDEIRKHLKQLAANPREKILAEVKEYAQGSDKVSMAGVLKVIRGEK